MTIGRKIAAARDDKDTILDKRKHAIQVRRIMTRTMRIDSIFIVNPIRTPKLVAMPLPPLKFKRKNCENFISSLF